MNGFVQWIDRVLPPARRRLVHGLMPAVVTILVLFGLAENVVTLWAAVVAAVLGAGVAFVNAENGWRRWLYGMIPPVQAVLVYYGVLQPNTVAALATVAATALGFGVAAAYTPAGKIDDAVRSGTAVLQDVRARAGEHVGRVITAEQRDHIEDVLAGRAAPNIREFLRGRGAP